RRNYMNHLRREEIAVTTSYWARVLRGRVGRRRMLAGAGASAAAAVFLAACGSDDDGAPAASTGTGGGATGSASTGGGTGTGAASTGGSSTGATGATSQGLVARPADTLALAKPGGVLRDFTRSEPAHLDGFVPLASLNQLARHPFGTLLREEAGYLEPSSSVVTGDLAERFEFSPDHLTLTMKM